MACSEWSLSRSLSKKVRQLEKSTPAVLVALVTNHSYERKREKRERIRERKERKKERKERKERERKREKKEKERER